MTGCAPRRAAALLLALAAVTLVPVIALGAARSASRARVGTGDAAAVASARDTARSLVSLLLEWASAHEAAPPEERVYSADLTTIFDLSEGRMRIAVKALDLSGRLHTDYLGGDLRSALPAELSLLGPTDFLVPDTPARARQRARRSAIPLYTSPLDELLIGSEINTLPPLRGERGWASYWLTTAGTGALNLRSAPRAYLDILMEGADPSVARALERDGGAVSPDLARRIIDAARSSNTNSGSDGDSLPLTERSSAWGFVITINEGPIAARWWLVAEPAQPGRTNRSPSTSGAWSATEFRRIAE